MLAWANGKFNNHNLQISSFAFNDKISEVYTLEIICHGSKDVSLPNLFDQTKFSFINGQGQMINISGMLMKISRQEDKIKQRWNYQLTIKPRLAILSLNRNIKLYPNTSVNEILMDLLARAAKALNSKQLPYQNLISKGLWTTPFKYLEISWGKTDLDYLQELIQYGIRFYFEETQIGERVTFVDASYKFPKGADLSFNPDKKEDIYQDEADIYQIIQHKNFINSQGHAHYYDPQTAIASLTNLMQTEQNPNIKNPQENYGNINQWAASCYSPVALQAALSESIDQLIHSNEIYYELHAYYSSLRAGQKLNLENIPGFIEQVQLKGIYQHQKWRFDTQAIFRPLTTKNWLGIYRNREKLPFTLTGAEIQNEDQVNDLGEFSVKFPMRMLTDPSNNPIIAMRDLQGTSTKGGGVSHSMSGKAEVLIASQNGASYGWIILGSLSNNECPNIVTSTNYQESRINTSGGVNIHLRHQDQNNPYSELNMSLNDSQNNPASLNLGTNKTLMTDAQSDQHGIQELSTGYAKRAIMGNYYDTVGDINNPIHQISLTQDPNTGITSFKRQINISNGNYAKTYYSKAIGAAKET